MKSFSLILAMLVLSSCASRGFNRETMRHDLKKGESRQISDEEIKKVFDLKPQLPKPFKIGVYFMDNHLRSYDLRWNSEDKDGILKLEHELQKSGEVSKMFIINDSLVQGHDLKSLRLAAAHHGADALLVVSATHDVDRYLNSWAATYLLVVPAFFVQGTVTDALYITRAALWDVRNEYLYMAVEAESFKRRTSSLVNEDRGRLLLRAKKESMTGLKKEILRMMSGMTK